MYVCILLILLFKDTDISITITQDTLQKKTNYVSVSVEHIMLFDLLFQISVFVKNQFFIK